ncbi:uncharacterized protein AC631_03732 [Debaryomyces fabryi]|uniref:Uncharacterized protein n=1 Tax=Debaryomyces fabryi TaxID=58627 RepID=A0A0V1PWR0_9ASCO|nr:uncharacterized protein AC631_03732 [Debaryomyces fabryi]KSA00501.1 hypothetical protein AC631_03732 [Debaryomyces fabryi]CUM45574.1 unnamed protein product [Debaryomyces fabryi]
MDKPHRSFFRSLERERFLYKKKHIVIEPSIKYLLVKLQKEKEGNMHEMKMSDQVLPNPFKIQNLLEPIVFHSTLSLLYILDNRGLDSKYLQSQHAIQVEHLTKILNKVVNFKSKKLNLEQIISQIEQEERILLDTIVSNLLSKFTDTEFSSITDNVFVESLKMAVLCFLILSKRAYKQQYSVDKDLIPWMLSIMAPGVSSSCESLRNLSRIPPCITSDILLRTPMSKNEYYLQADLWLDFMKDIGSAYHKRIKHLKLCINNLIFYGIQYDSHKLPELIFRTLNFFTSTSSGYQFLLVSPEFLNGIIWKVIFDYLRSSITSKPNIMTNIIKTQEVVVQFLSKVGDKREKVHSKLNIEGNMGIVLAINNVSQEKSEKLFKIAEKKLMLSDSHHSISKSMVSFHFTRIFLSITPEELLHNFNSGASDHFQSATLWLGFIKKLNEFGLLNEKRSKKILLELVNNKERILITKDIILLLLQPIKTLREIDEFISILQTKTDSNEKGSLLAMAHSSSILPKYLTILYKNVHLRSMPHPEMKYPWDRYQKLHPITTIKDSKSPQNFKNFSSILSYARYLYDTGFKKKTSKIVGIMLNGEVNVQPEHIYDLYKLELFEKNNFNPDESCLAALIKAAMRQSDRNDKSSCLMWGDMYAPQVAIHEFKQHVMTEAFDKDLGKADNDPRVYPQDDLWQKYIHLLAKYDYISELSTIIQWWEHLNFKPNYITLLMLLGSLPTEYGSRYIKHVEKVKEDSAKSTYAHIGEDPKSIVQNYLDWSWPTLDELERFKVKKLKLPNSNIRID